ncbi:MAG: CPBP family intramembrane glutamic endopeptidase [Prolixibacteraceae bacterium]
MTTKTIGPVNNLYSALLKGGLATAILAFFFLFFTWGKCSSGELLLLALPFFLLLYFTQFTLGTEAVTGTLQKWIEKSIVRALLFPTLMLVFYVGWMLLNNQNLLEGKLWLLIYIVYFPVIVFGLINNPNRKIGWIDFTLFVIMLIPTGFFSIDQNSDIPIGGGGFDSVSHVMIILTGVYAFAVLRDIKDVGFVAELKWKSLLIALLVWAAYYLFVFVFGSSVNFIAIIGYNETIDIMLKSILFTLLGTFLHTALFEELFFRGILQNLLAKRIAQGKSWLIFWQIGFFLLLIGALLVGYTLEGKMKWFPALITVILFVSAYLIEKSGKYGMGIYTSLAITGVTFGLVHYHAKSIIYIGLACLAGWAYGYTYIKTKNVFYSALVHVLVNTGVLIFGLKMIR